MMLYPKKRHKNKFNFLGFEANYFNVSFVFIDTIL